MHNSSVNTTVMMNEEENFSFEFTPIPNTINNGLLTTAENINNVTEQISSYNENNSNQANSISTETIDSYITIIPTDKSNRQTNQINNQQLIQTVEEKLQTDEINEQTIATNEVKKTNEKQPPGNETKTDSAETSKAQSTSSSSSLLSTTPTVQCLVCSFHCSILTAKFCPKCGIKFKQQKNDCKTEIKRKGNRKHGSYYITSKL